MIKLGLLFLFLSSSLMAMPKSFEIWFLSPDKREVFLPSKHLQKNIQYFRPVAQNDLQCQPMGEYCFDPQVGMYKLDDKNQVQANVDYTAADSLEDYSNKRVAKGSERKQASCEDGDFFSLFCNEGKAQSPKSAKVEVWVDTSSTMKQVDFAGYDTQCKRESFLRLITQDCSFNEEVKVYIFDEVKKQLGRMDRVCLNAGLNNRDRIIRDIKISKAAHLIIITDIFEADEKLLNFVETAGVGSVKGIEKPMYAADLKKFAPQLQKKCL
ncbi:MAG: hypothetical protein KC478_08775 [Bacteriovoracaceae bacterium]|nr:hypothetical protein [Bacteriovoracaceae bacterium]